MGFERLLRFDDRSPEAVRVDLYWLLGFTLLLVATGIGLRDPWPADEPRFALVARDMALTGHWLIPSIGGDLYADKPPLFFWIVGALYALTGSLRFALLAPGLISALLSVALMYDLARRLWDRQTGLAAGLGLLGTIQFVWQMRQGQIDATLFAFSTLGLYSFLRHLLLGPAWRWYFVGWVAAGFGVITKGVGFLPILTLAPYALARAGGWIPAAPPRSCWQWWVGPLAMLAAIAVWLAPMLLAAASDPAIAAYRDEILFKQTVTRYAEAWHHREPFWYFILEVIPVLWLPLIAFTPWLLRPWRERWRARDLRTWLPLAWMALVLVFFSLSSGKRGVYILPAAPAFILAAAPFLRELAARRAPNRLLFAIVCAIAIFSALAGAYLVIEGARRTALIDWYEFDFAPALFAVAVVAGIACAVARAQRGLAAFGGFLAGVLLIISFWVNPAMNDARSSREFIREVEARSAGARELGLVSYKAQYLLQVTRPVVSFGHARWRESKREVYDAAAWKNAAEGRVLLVDAHARELCFKGADAQELDEANRKHWFLISGPADPQCAAKGDLAVARLYTPPHGAH